MKGGVRLVTAAGNVGLLASVFFAWSSVGVATSPGRPGPILSLHDTRSALAAVERALATQSVIRAVIECAMVAVAGTGLALTLVARPAHPPVRTRLVLAGAALILAAAACFLLPLGNTPAGLTVRPAAFPTPAAYAALGLACTTLLAAIAGARAGNTEDSVQSGQRMSTSG